MASDTYPNVVKLLKETVVIIRKQLWLFCIGWMLDRYCKVSEKNKSRYWKVQRMADRYNYIFADDLFCETATEDE